MKGRSGAWLGWSLILIGSLVDVVILGVVRWISTTRVANQSPPALELSFAQIALLYLAQGVLVGFGVWILARGVPTVSRTGRWVFMSAATILVLRAVLVGREFMAPVDRGRLAMTSARVRNAEASVMSYWNRNQRLPADLSEAGLKSDALIDAWGFRLAYVVDSDQGGFTIRCVGIPPRARSGINERDRIEAVRRVPATD